MKNTGNRLDKASLNSDFKEYLLSEYSNIAQAHFKTIETISTFFRNYLVIVSIPISVIAVLAGVFAGPELLKTLLAMRIPLSLIFLVVSLVGLGVLLYIASLRMDAILYARTINGIRKYFYDQAVLDFNTKLRMRVLPQSPSIPAYHEKAYFWPVVGSFAGFNTLYLVFSAIAFFLRTEAAQTSDVLTGIPVWVGLVAVAFFVGHFGLYCGYACHRERAYLRSNIIGVDIDGVLTQHRKQFCDILNKSRGKSIAPDAITAIPVRECESLGVSKEDEEAVFNDPDYWIKMPVEQGAAYNLERIRNVFKLKVFIFTYRPWPTVEKLNQNEQVATQWARALETYMKKVSNRSPSRNLKRKPMDAITRLWLKEQGIGYDRLFVEKGSEEIQDPRGHVRNRFVKSREYRIKYFVEDDAEKAVKLAYICDVVFLLQQPYNEGATELPGNVIPIKSWDELYVWLRRVV